MWSSAAMGAAATRALRKLEAAGVEVGPLPEGLQPRIETTGAAFPAIAEAVHDGKVLTFDYRTSGPGEASQRTVEPWGVVSWRSRWYLVGHDRDRDEARVFRLSRVVGDAVASGAAGAVTRPVGIDLTAVVASYAQATPTS